MKTTRRAMESLKRSKKESLSYLITLILSASLLLLFINIQSDPNYTAQEILHKEQVMNSFLLGGFTLLIALICAINCYVANNYFVKAKNEELCVYLSCGMKITVLAKFLITQNMVLLMIAVLVGGVLGCALNPIMNYIIYQITGIGGILFTINIKGILMWLLILFFEMFFLIMINVGYTYRTELKDLLDESRSTKLPDFRTFKIPNIFHVIICIVSFILLCFVPAKTDYFTICSMIAFVGVKGVLTYYLPGRSEKRKKKHKNIDSEQMIVQGNVNALMKSSFMYNHMIFGTVLLVSCITSEIGILSYVHIILLIAFLLAILLMGASIYFKILIEAGIRKKEFYQLSLLGLSKETQRHCIHKEIIRFYTYLLAFPIPYALVISTRYILDGVMSIGIPIFILGTLCVLVITLMILSIRTYETIIIEKGEQ